MTERTWESPEFYAPSVVEQQRQRHGASWESATLEMRKYWVTREIVKIASVFSAEMPARLVMQIVEEADRLIDAEVQR